MNSKIKYFFIDKKCIVIKGKSAYVNIKNISFFIPSSMIFDVFDKRDIKIGLMPSFKYRLVGMNVDIEGATLIEMLKN